MHTEHPVTDPTKAYDTTELPLGGILKGLGALAAMAILAGPVSYLVMIQMSGPGGSLQFSGRPDQSHVPQAKLPAAPNPKAALLHFRTFLRDLFRRQLDHRTHPPRCEVCCRHYATLAGPGKWGLFSLSRAAGEGGRASAASTTG